MNNDIGVHDVNTSIIYRKIRYLRVYFRKKTLGKHSYLVDQKLISFAHAALESLTRSGVSEHHKLREHKQTRGSLAADEGDVEE